jgi:hypothetical protein
VSRPGGDCPPGHFPIPRFFDRQPKTRSLADAGPRWFRVGSWANDIEPAKRRPSRRHLSELTMPRRAQNALSSDKGDAEGLEQGLRPPGGGHQDGDMGSAVPYPHRWRREACCRGSLLQISAPIPHPAMHCPTSLLLCVAGHPRPPYLPLPSFGILSTVCTIAFGKRT